MTPDEEQTLRDIRDGVCEALFIIACVVVAAAAFWVFA